MAGGNKLAELFIDISVRGGGKVELIDLHNKIKASDKALANNAGEYERLTRGKIRQLGKLADRQSKLAQEDYKTYGSKRYLDLLRKEDAAGKEMSRTEEYRDFQKNVVEKGKGRAVLGALFQRFRTGNAAEGGLGGGALGTAASVAGAAGQAAAIAAPVAAAVAGVFYASLRLAAGTSENAESLLSGSWKMVMNEIGMNLLPVLVEFSRALQEAARIVRDNKGAMSFVSSIARGLWDTSGIGAVTNGLNLMVGNGGMLASSSAKASFSGFEDGWRRIQQEAASGGSLEAQLLQQQIEANIKLQQLVQNTAPASQPQPGNV